MILISKNVNQEGERHMHDEIEVWLERIHEDKGEIKLSGQATETLDFINRFILLLPTALDNKGIWHFRVMYGVEYHGGWEESDHNFHMHFSIPANKTPESIIACAAKFAHLTKSGIEMLDLHKLKPRPDTGELNPHKVKRRHAFNPYAQ